jgi:hypothetical protein
VGGMVPDGVSVGAASVAVGSAVVGVASGGTCVAEGNGVSCAGTGDAASGVPTRDGTCVGVGALHARTLATSPTRARSKDACRSFLIAVSSDQV